MKNVILLIMFIIGITFTTAWAVHPICIDGLFEDWSQVPLAATDPANDHSIEDFAQLKITNDNDFLFLNLSFHNGEYLMQDWNEIHLYIDTDFNIETGMAINGIGAELEWCFGCREGVFYSPVGNDSIYQNDIVLRMAPTITSGQFEIALSRSCNSMTLNGTQNADTIAVVIVESDPDGDILPNGEGGIQYILDNTLVSQPEPVSLSKYNESDIRLVTYNTWHSGLYNEQRGPYFERILKALDPDIMGFQEQDSISAVELLIASWLPNNTWYTSNLYHGELFVISKYPILQDAPLINSERMHAVLLDTETELGSNLLVINTHLLCCGWDYYRQLDSDEYTKVMREWKTGDGPFPLNFGTPFINMGDFNLVGYSQQVKTLREGDIVNEAEFGEDSPPDWDGTSLVDLFSRHTHIRMGYTWRSDRSSFSPGKLDYIFYSNSVIEIGNHFVLNTLAMPNSELLSYGLQTDDTQFASDHLPRVVDIVGVHPVSIEVKDIKPGLLSYFKLYNAYPNPFNPSTKIKFTLPKQEIVTLEVYNIIGQKIETLLNKPMPAGYHEVEFNAQNLSSGVYFYRIEAGKFQDVKKMILLR